MIIIANSIVVPCLIVCSIGCIKLLKTETLAAKKSQRDANTFTFGSMAGSHDLISSATVNDMSL